jgi:hypothetical protein
MSRRYADSRSLSFIERRAQKVLVIESLPTTLEGTLNKLVSTLWQ